MSFSSFPLSASLIETLEKSGLTQPTPIQNALIPVLLKGQNAVASAQTGSGKTLAFLLPILEKILLEARPVHHYPKAFILSPTKELAQQIYEVTNPFAEVLGLKVVLLQGGGNRTQESNTLKQGIDIIIATPQRALEHIEARHIDIKGIKHLVVDEADMMFDMGFVSYVEKIFGRMTEKSQKVIVSATITSRVVKLAKTHMKPVQRIEIDPPGKIADTITQCLYPVLKSKKDALLAWLISSNQFGKVLLFVRKIELADTVAENLKEWGYKVGILHGERKHQERKKSLRAFKNGTYQILVATDIAARGLDITDLDVVINYDIPHVKHDFIHRVGRTGRAGKEGIAITLVSPEELEQLNDLHKLLGTKIEEIILPEYAPKEVKARGCLLIPAHQQRMKKNPAKKGNSIMAKQGKKRKTTKRDGWKVLDGSKEKKKKPKRRRK